MSLRLCFQSRDDSPAPVSWLPLRDTKKASSACKEAFHQWLSEKRGITLTSWFPLPSGNLRASSFNCQRLAHENKIPETEGFTEIISTIVNNVTNLTNWWTEMTLFVHLMVAGEHPDEAWPHVLCI